MLTDYFLGCDGGGTKTALVVVTSQGRVAASMQAPSTYYLSSRGHGVELVGEVLGQAVPEVCAQAGISPLDLRFAFFGLPGYGEVRADIPRLEAAASHALGHDRFRCDNDMVCGWAGSLGCADGINVIAGTGSMTYGRRAGTGVRVGGWGELFGDEGSGYWIATRALRAFTKMSDGRARPGPLHELVARELHLAADIDVVDRVLFQWQGARSRVAALAPAVGEAARLGDICAQSILSDAAAELISIVDATRRRLGFGDSDVVLVSYSGGVFAMPEVLHRFSYGIGVAGAGYRLTEPEYEPVIGAALYAAVLAGSPLQPNALAWLRTAGAGIG